MIFIKGFLLSLTMIIPIGPQNAFVIKQGIKKQNINLTIITVALCDAILITLGILGIGKLLAKNILFNLILAIVGIIFLLYYGINSLYNSIKPKEINIENSKSVHSYKKIIFKAISFSWLNPHSILDTVVIIGSISTQYKFKNSIFFGLGCISGSFIWFTFLGYMSKLFSKYLKVKIAWRIIDVIIGLVCVWISIDLFIKTLPKFLNLFQN